MNKKEYFLSDIYLKNAEYKNIQKRLHEWKQKNNIIERCVVHHRDDTEECKKYNEEHYELWGFNEDGSFEYGKYVIFLTRAEHCKHHHTGENNVNYGKGPMLGRHFTYEHRMKLSLANSGERSWHYGKPSPRRGKKHSLEAIERIRLARSKQVITYESRKKMSDSMHTKLEPITNIYRTYKQRGGLLKWNPFRSALKNNNPEVVNLISDILNNL